jgi:hypothetical protein
VFSQTAKGWNLAARKVALSEAGEFAEQPQATLQQLGPDHFGFRIEESHTGGGEGTLFGIFEISGDAIRKVLSAWKDSSFMSDRCWPMPLSQAWKACVEYTGGISLVPGANPEYFDIVLTRRVTGSVTKRIPRGTYVLHYQYESGKYVVKDSALNEPRAGIPAGGVDV